ncbi:MAG: hypothetical protein MO852_14180 [Candidatus Devosia euplotis]|nr:hypothetical protein [Candidatus Devosia euplotis]
MRRDAQVLNHIGMAAEADQFTLDEIGSDHVAGLLQGGGAGLGFDRADHIERFAQRHRV